jgi:CheY-like chemotaxis protein
VLDKAKITPPRQPAGGTRPAAASPPASQAPGLRILVVEDNPDARQMLGDLLGALGHMTREAGSAEEAFDLLRGDVFDVLLTDVGLPGKSGVELARKAVDANPSLRVILSSGFGAVTNDMPEALSLPKPYNLEKLMNVLAKTTKPR